MNFVDSIQDIKNNISTLNTYLEKGKGAEVYEYAVDRIKKGMCFVVVNNNENYSFYPSRFVGYENNSMYDHENSEIKDGRETNTIISKVLKTKLVDEIHYYDDWIIYEKLYVLFCREKGFTPLDKVSFRSKEKNGSGRKYWIAEW